MQERYNFKDIEKKWQERWERDAVYRVEEEPQKKSIIVWKCFLIHRGIYIWDMFGIILLGM